MQSQNDFVCVDCRNNYESASELLKHFARHVSNETASTRSEADESSKSNNKKNAIPDLYPINIFKQLQGNYGELNGKLKVHENGHCNVLNPLKFCEVTYESLDVDDRDAFNGEEVDNIANLSTHISEMSDDYAVACKFCDYNCKKVSLLEKHMKYHKYEHKLHKVDSLSPTKIKSRKQEKSNIKRKTYTKLLRQNNSSSLLCST